MPVTEAINSNTKAILRIMISSLLIDRQKCFEGKNNASNFRVESLYT
jgi:hypothetical protein